MKTTSPRWTGRLTSAAASWTTTVSVRLMISTASGGAPASCGGAVFFGGRLRARLAKHFLFKIGNTRLQLCVLHVAKLSLDRVDLRMQGDDLMFSGHVTGERAKANSGAPICLVAYGEANSLMLNLAGLGKTVPLTSDSPTAAS